MFCAGCVTQNEFIKWRKTKKKYQREKEIKKKKARRKIKEEVEKMKQQVPLSK